MTMDQSRWNTFGVHALDSDIQRVNESLRQISRHLAKSEVLVISGLVSDCKISAIEELRFDLISDIHRYFERQEKFMKSISYAAEKPLEYAAHVENHAALAETISKVVLDRDCLHRALADRILVRAISDWMTQHVANHDRSLAEYVLAEPWRTAKDPSESTHQRIGNSRTL